MKTRGLPFPGFFSNAHLHHKKLRFYPAFFALPLKIQNGRSESGCFPEVRKRAKGERKCPEQQISSNAVSYGFLSLERSIFF